MHALVPCLPSRSVLQRHEANREIVKHTCKALACIARVADNLPLLAAERIIPVALAVLQRHGGSVTVVVECWILLIQFVVDKGAGADALAPYVHGPAGIIAVAVDLLRDYVDHAAIAERTCAAIYMLACRATVEPLLADAGAIPVVIDTLQRHLGIPFLAAGACGYLGIVARTGTRRSGRTSLPELAGDGAHGAAAAAILAALRDDVSGADEVLVRSGYRAVQQLAALDFMWSWKL